MRNIQSCLGYVPEPKRPIYPPCHGWTCISCGAPRAWDEVNQTSCMLCSSKEPPIKGEAGSITLDISVPGGTEKWVLTFKENKPAWVILGKDRSQPTSTSSSSKEHEQSGTYGPEDALKDLTLLSDQLKRSSAEPVGDLATEAPVEIDGTSDHQFSDFVGKKDRCLNLNSQFDDEEARQQLVSQGIDVPDFDPDQESVAFHPELIQTKALLVGNSDAIQEVDRLAADPAYKKQFLE